VFQNNFILCFCSFSVNKFNTLASTNDAIIVPVSCFIVSLIFNSFVSFGVLFHCNYSLSGTFTGKKLETLPFPTMFSFARNSAQNVYKFIFV